MSIQIILLIIGLALIFFLAFKLLKGIIKAAITVFVLALLLIGVFGIIIYADATTLKKGFEGEKTIVILYQDEVVTAFKATTDVTIRAAIRQDFFESLTIEELNELKEKIENEEYDEIEKEELLLIINQEVFYDEEILINDKKINLSKEILNDLAQSKTLNEAISAIGKHPEINQEDLTISDVAHQDFLNQIYYELFKNKLKNTKGTFIIDGIKDKKIDTRPQLLSIKIINFFPESIMKRLVRVEEWEYGFFRYI